MQGLQTVKPIKKKSSFIKQIPLQSMVWIGLIQVFLFAYVPMFGIIIGFQDYSLSGGFFDSPWVGLKHFAEFFQDSTFQMAFKNTVLLALIRLVCCFPMPIILALILNEVKSPRLKKVSQTASYFPHFVAYVVVAALWITILDTRGLANSALMGLGIIEQPIEFWTDPGKFRILAVIVENWKEMGWSAIIYVAAISGISPELYEAAQMDGATRLQRIWYITFPGISGTIAVMLILQVGNLFKGNLDQSMLLGNVFNKETSYIIEHYALDMGFKTMRHSFATAVSLFQSVLSLVLVLGANWLSGKISGKKMF